ncbi:hypothetical protein [Natrinema marinum]|uniref:hypothetical protein n=1 Tax=Natrinema marinum TaxID=2961598 RepID=UPI0020C86770|nr:hypothetical protein [Natrinema marinum]
MNDDEIIFRLNVIIILLGTIAATLVLAALSQWLPILSVVFLLGSPILLLALLWLLS